MTATKAVFWNVAALRLSPPLSCCLSVSHSLSCSLLPPFINFLSRMTNEAPYMVYLVAVLWGLTQINSLRCALITWTLKSIHCLTLLLSFNTWPAAVKHPAIKLNAQQTCEIHTVIESLLIHNVYMIITVTLPELNHYRSAQKSEHCNSSCCYMHSINGEIKYIAQIYRLNIEKNNINLVWVWISQKAVCFQNLKVIITWTTNCFQHYREFARITWTWTGIWTLNKVSQCLKWML